MRGIVYHIYALNDIVAELIFNFLCFFVANLGKMLVRSVCSSTFKASRIFESESYATLENILGISLFVRNARSVSSVANGMHCINT